MNTVRQWSKEKFIALATGDIDAYLANDPPAVYVPPTSNRTSEHEHEELSAAGGGKQCKTCEKHLTRGSFPGYNYRGRKNTPAWQLQGVHQQEES